MSIANKLRPPWMRKAVPAHPLPSGRRFVVTITPKLHENAMMWHAEAKDTTNRWEAYKRWHRSQADAETGISRWLDSIHDKEAHERKAPVTYGTD